MVIIISTAKRCSYYTSGYQWVPVGTNGYQWVPVGTSGYQLVPVGTSGYQRVSTGTSGYQEYQEDQDQISGATYISDVFLELCMNPTFQQNMSKSFRF